MYPHPPRSSRTSNIPNIKSRTYKQFPGMGDNLRSPNKQNINKKDAVKLSNKRKEDAVALSPLKPAPGVHKKTTREMDICSENRTLPGTSRMNNPGVIRSSCGHLERSESFSKYKPLPAINDKKDKKEKCKDKISNKRTFETWSGQETNTETEINPEKDDMLLDTIKRMKLGNAGLISNESSYLEEEKKIQINSRKNPFDRYKSKELYTDNKPSTSSIALIIRLPDGERVQHSFSSSDTLGDMVEYLSKIMDKKLDMKRYVLYTNEVPKRELKNRKSTIVALGIQDKSVLALDTRDLPDRK